MKLAYFSPLPPQKSGISDYSEVLLPYLSRHFDIDLWVGGGIPDKSLSRKYQIIDFHSSKAQLSKLKNYDYIVYNIGNNPEYHAEIYDAFLEYPGHVILHDFVLYFLITGYYLDYKHDRESYIKEFYMNYGYEGIHKVKKILRGFTPPLHYENPELYPLIKKIILTARGIIVHSESTKNLLINLGYPSDKVIQINQVNYQTNFEITVKERPELKEKYGVRPDEILITSFGYISSTKRNKQVIEVINEVNAVTSHTVKYLMVGEGNYVDGLLSENIRKTGFVSLNEFEKLIQCSDIIINLRYPSMGETSATLLRGMTAGKPCIVSNIAWFSELPDDTVIKIKTDSAFEKTELFDALSLFLNDQTKRIEYGRKARSYSLRVHNPDKIAKKMADFITNKCKSSENFSLFYSDINDTRINELGIINEETFILRDYRDTQSERIRAIGIIPNINHQKKNRLKQVISKIFFWRR